MAVSLKKPVVDTTYSEKPHKISLAKEQVSSHTEEAYHDLSGSMIDTQNDADEIYSGIQVATTESLTSKMTDNHEITIRQKGTLKGLVGRMAGIVLCVEGIFFFLRGISKVIMRLWTSFSFSQEMSNLTYMDQELLLWTLLAVAGGVGFSIGKKLFDKNS